MDRLEPERGPLDESLEPDAAPLRQALDLCDAEPGRLELEADSLEAALAAIEATSLAFLSPGPVAIAQGLPGRDMETAPLYDHKKEARENVQLAPVSSLPMMAA